MKQFVEIYKKTRNLHHAYVIEGDRKAARMQLYEFLENEVGFSILSNPDFYYSESELFGIGEGRNIREMASRKSVLGGLRIFISAFTTITKEAQNSLLKIFEEPPANTHFFVIVPRVDIILPTLLSRVSIISIRKQEGSGDKFINKFISSGKANRIGMLNEIIEGNDRRKALDVLNKVEKAFYRVTDWRRSGSEKIAFFEEVNNMRKNLNARSTSIKIILEHISLITPVLK